MAKLNIKKGDNVLVIAGKENGKTSTVLECFPEENKVTVRGLNIIAKHNKPRSAQDKGGIVRKEGKIDASNLMVVCPACDKATRIKMGLNDKNQKVRVCKHCGAALDTGAKKPVEKKTAKKTSSTEAKSEKKTTAKSAEKPAVKLSTKPAAKKETTTKTTKKTATKTEVGGTNG